MLDLAVRVRAACLEKLGSFCGPDKVGVLPEVPHPMDMGELPEAPVADDTSAFEAWREALMARSFERGEQQGFERGEQQGLERGELRGLVEALFTVLSARGVAVDLAARARIEACADTALLKDWLARANEIAAADALFTEEPAREPAGGQ